MKVTIYLVVKSMLRELLQAKVTAHKDHWCHHVNIFEDEQLADDVIILKLIVTSSYGEVSGAEPNRVDTPNGPNFGL